MSAWIVGLTGGVASGKSHVLRLFMDLGVPTIEADDVARTVVALGSPALATIAQHFGPQMLETDGSLNRRALREVVFNHPEALRELEAITHPQIRVHLKQWIDALQAPYGVLSAAILLERGLADLTDRVLVVDTPEHTQIQRLTVRDGISIDLAQAMLNRQWTRAERLARADDVLENPDPPSDLRAQVLALHQFYLRGK